MTTWSIMSDINYVYNRGKMRIIMIAEFHDIFRASLRNWVFMNFAAFHIGEARNAEEAVSLAIDRQPDIILINGGIHRIKDLETIRCIKRALSHIRVEILTMYENAEYQSAAMAAGADICLIKSKIRNEPFPVLTNFLSA